MERKVNPKTGPIRALVIKSQQAGSLRTAFQNHTMESGVLSHQRFASASSGYRIASSMASSRPTHKLHREQSPQDGSDFETERTKKSSPKLLSGSDGAVGMLASSWQRPRPFAADALDMNRLELSRSHHLCDSTGVVTIGLQRHG